MPTEGGQTGALAANADSGNVLSGKTWEWVPATWRRGANVRVAAIAGLAASTTCKVDFKINATSHADGRGVPYDSVARGVQIDKDVCAEGWAPPGSRLYLNFNSGSVAAGAPGVNWVISVDPA